MNHPRVLFTSYHCYHDPASGAAVCTRDLFAALASRGWDCSAFTGPHLDDPMAPPAAVVLRERAGVRTVHGTADGATFAVHTLDEPTGFAASVVVTDPPIAARPPTPQDATVFSTALAEHVSKFRPDVVLTYGGDPASRSARRVARAVGAKVAFWLHNFAYADRGEFADCDAVVVPSAFSRDHHARELGRECIALPPVIDPIRVLVDRPEGGKFVTFVNPEPNKGVFWFARLAEVLGRMRPDIPFLVVEGRGRIDWLERTGVDWRGIDSVCRMANAADPRLFYRLSRLVVIPSLWRESFGRVAAEAMLNGIPVVASDRGALPETVGDGGLCLPIPPQFTPDTGAPPSAEDVTPWIAALLRLWDDPSEYAAASQSARRAAARWHANSVTGQWEEFLTSTARSR